MTTLSTDVLIVGAGPAGLASAIGLAQRGIDTIIIDALPETQNTSRAAVIHAATLNSLAGLQVADRLIAQGLKVRYFRVRDRDQVLMVLIGRLDELGEPVRRPLRLRSHEITQRGVRAICTGADGDIAIDARFLIGADGENSTVRAGAGIAFPGETYGSFLLADVRMDWPIAKDEVTLFFSGAGTLVVAPMSQARYRVVAQLADAPAEPSVEDVQRIIDTRGPATGARVREVLWGSRFRVHHKLADRFRAGPVLLLGDAAHVHSPAGGQGMNLGLRDAEALAAAVVQALRSGSDSALDAYARDRRQAAATVLAQTDRLTKVATMSSPTARWFRNRLIAGAALLPGVRRGAARTLAGLNE